MKLFSQATWVFADRAAFAVSIFATGALIARCYGAQGFGLYVFVSAIAQTVLGAISVGAEVPFLRAFVGTTDTVARARLVRSLTRGLCMTAACAGMLMLSAGLLYGHVAPSAQTGESSLQHMLWASSLTFVQLPWHAGEWRLRAHGASSRISRIRVPALCVGFAAKVLVADAGLPLPLMYAVISLEAAIVCVLLSTVAGRVEVQSAPVLEPDPSAVSLRRSDVLRQGLGSLASVMFTRANAVMLGLVAGVDQAAAYGAAFALVMAFDLVTNSVSSVALPQVLRDRSDEQTRLALFARLGRIYAGLSVLYVAGLVLLGDRLLVLVYGPSWDAAYWVLVVLGVSSLFTSSGAMRGLYINLIGRSDLHVANALLGLTALLPLSWVLSQHYGALGAAISMSIACALNAIAASFLFEPTRVIGRIQLRAFLPRIG